MDYRWRIVGGLALAGLAVLSASVAAGTDGPARKLINAQGCKACHALEGDGGTAAPSFTVMRETLTRAEVRRQLVNPTQRHGSGRIADFSHLSEAEIDALVSFIQPQP